MENYIEKSGMESKISSKKRIICGTVCVIIAGLLLLAGIGIGYQIQPKAETSELTGYASNPDYEYLAGVRADASLNAFATGESD